jgi:hypothetical protein
VQAGILSSYSISFMGYNETVPVGWWDTPRNVG